MDSGTAGFGPKGLGNLAQALAWVTRPQRL
jgi:hypothetical protein